MPRWLSVASALSPVFSVIRVNECRAGCATACKSGTSYYFLLEECKSGDLPLYCWLEQTYPDVSSQVNFLNLPNWDIIDRKAG
jgi:hypothetical protein